MMERTETVIFAALLSFYGSYEQAKRDRNERHQAHRLPAPG
jgi:hypothetical protein